jgi:hypothetical protein
MVLLERKRVDRPFCDQPGEFSDFHAEPDSDSEAHRNSEPDSDSEAHRNSEPDSDSEAHRNAQSNSNSES